MTRPSEPEQDAGREIFQVRLDGEEENRRQVLENEHAERDASGQGVEFLFFVEDFDNDDRAAERGGHPEIKRVPLAATEAKPATFEESNAQHHATDDLHERSQGNRFPRADNFLQIDLQADHEEKKNQPELRDRGDALG